MDSAVSASNDLSGNKTVRGLINAVLRNFVRQRPALLDRAMESEVGRFSHPQWWINKLRAQYPHQYQTILEASNLRAPMTLRVNRRRVDAVEYQDPQTSGNGRATVGRRCARTGTAAWNNILPGFAEGLSRFRMWPLKWRHRYSVHDGMRVLDACAAPGGKSAHLLELAEMELIAVDNDAARAAPLRKISLGWDSSPSHYSGRRNATGGVVGRPAIRSYPS